MIANGTAAVLQPSCCTGLHEIKLAKSISQVNVSLAPEHHNNLVALCEKFPFLMNRNVCTRYRSVLKRTIPMNVCIKVSILRLFDSFGWGQTFSQIRCCLGHTNRASDALATSPLKINCLNAQRIAVAIANRMEANETAPLHLMEHSYYRQANIHSTFLAIFLFNILKINSNSSEKSSRRELHYIFNAFFTSCKCLHFVHRLTKSVVHNFAEVMQKKKKVILILLPFSVAHKMPENVCSDRCAESECNNTKTTTTHIDERKEKEQAKKENEKETLMEFLHRTTYRMKTYKPPKLFSRE